MYGKLYRMYCLLLLSCVIFSFSACQKIPPPIPAQISIPNEHMRIVNGVPVEWLGIQFLQKEERRHRDEVEEIYVYEASFKLTRENVEQIGLRWKTSPECIERGGGHSSSASILTKRIKFQTSPDVKTMDVRVGIASGEWETAAVYRKGKTKILKDTGPDFSFSALENTNALFDCDIQTYHNLIPFGTEMDTFQDRKKLEYISFITARYVLSEELLNQQLRIFALDTGGGITEGIGHLEMNGDVRRQHAFFHNLPVERLREVHFQTRRFVWISFNDLRLKGPE